MNNLSRKPSLGEALIPIIFLISLLSVVVIVVYKDAALDGANQFSLLLSAGVAAIIGLRLGYKWKYLFKGAINSISSAMPAMIIILLIGSLAGTWMLSGIVPAMIYYGLQILSPQIFLFAACIICSIVSLAIGSSWSTVATVGIALLGIGKAMGWSEGLIAGAVISGAYFGDKMSPLSDTTNLAPAVAGTDLFTHIRYMTITTVPSIIITLIIFLVIGFTGGQDIPIDQLEGVLAALRAKFNLNPLLFLVPAAMIFMIVRKVNAVPALLISALLGGLFAIIFQPQVIEQVSGVSGDALMANFKGVMDALTTSISITTDSEMANELLSTGGMAGMLNTIWLILCAMIFGGIMEAGGLLQRITEALISRVRSTGSLVGTTAFTSMFFNVSASDQYLAIVVPGRMFAKAFRDRELAPQNLSRTLEDTGTVTSVLVPWNTCGATQAGVLGVATVVYLPYCFFNIISPFMTLLVAFIGYKIKKLEAEPESGEVISGQAA